MPGRRAYQRFSFHARSENRRVAELRSDRRTTGCDAGEIGGQLAGPPGPSRGRPSPARAMTASPSPHLLVTAARAGAGAVHAAGYSPPNFLISSNSASVSSRGTSSLATFELCTCRRMALTISGSTRPRIRKYPSAAGGHRLRRSRASRQSLLPGSWLDLASVGVHKPFGLSPDRLEDARPRVADTVSPACSASSPSTNTSRPLTIGDFEAYWPTRRRQTSTLFNFLAFLAGGRGSVMPGCGPGSFSSSDRARAWTACSRWGRSSSRWLARWRVRCRSSGGRGGRACG